MIIFKSVSFKNFLSTGDQPTKIILNQAPTTLILGDNGAGKSTLLDALSYGLFGKAYRNINIPQLANSFNESDMVVEIDLQIGPKDYLIRRGIKPAIFEIYVDGSLIPQDSRKKDYQTEFEQNVLHLSYKSFCQVVVLGIATFTPFMQLPAADRRFVIEDILGIQIFSAMNKMLKTKSDTLRGDLSTAESKFETTEEKIDLVLGHIEQAKADVNNSINQRTQLIEQKLTEKLDVVGQVERIEKTIEELTKKSATFDTLQDKIKNLEVLEDKLSTKINKFRDEIQFFSTNDVCPTCQQTIDSQFKENTIKLKSDKIVEMESALVELNEKVKTDSLKLESIRKILTAIRQHEIDVNVLNNKIKFIEKSVSDIEEEIKGLGKKSLQKITGEKQLTQLNDELAIFKSKRDECIELRHYYELVSLMLKDTGIKTQIIRKYLPLINKYVNKYLSDMGFFVNFHLDEAFKEVIKSRGRDEFSYESFSQGEKLRIDLSLLFTWREIAKMKNSANTNILILDEVFDSSLDNSGVEEFMKLIQIVGKGINIYIITHKGDVLMDKFDNCIRFKKEKNFSIVDTN